MKILVDADACPVVKITESITKANGIKCVLLCDTNHVLYSDYSEVRTIGAGTDAVDFALINACSSGDIVVTQDYGLAALILSKGAYPIHQSGRVFTDDNIGGLLMDRHLHKQARRASSKSHMKGPSKRTREDDEKFARALQELIAQRQIP